MCKGELERLISAPAIQFKGAGWYVNDYAGKGSKPLRIRRIGQRLRETGGAQRLLPMAAMPLRQTFRDHTNSASSSTANSSRHPEPALRSIRVKQERVTPHSPPMPPDFFFAGGTFAPALRASDRPMAIACLRLVTFFPLRPDFSFPCFIAFISRSTDCGSFGTVFPPSRFFLCRTLFCRALLLCWHRAFLHTDGKRAQGRRLSLLREPTSEIRTLRLRSGQVVGHPSSGNLHGRFDDYGFLSEAISMTKRYFTSAFTTRSKASLICWMGITSTSDDDVVLGAVVEHLLRLRHAPDDRSGQSTPLER